MKKSGFALWQVGGGRQFFGLALPPAKGAAVGRWLCELEERRKGSQPLFEPVGGAVVLAKGEGGEPGPSLPR